MITTGTFTDKNDAGQIRSWRTLTIYNGKSYNVRVLKDKNGNLLLIADDELESVLTPYDENLHIYVIDQSNPEAARKVYDQIFFFTDSATLRYSDEDLRRDLDEELPGIF